MGQGNNQKQAELVRSNKIRIGRMKFYNNRKQKAQSKEENFIMKTQFVLKFRTSKVVMIKVKEDVFLLSKFSHAANSLKVFHIKYFS